MNQLKLITKNCRQKNVGEHGLSEKELNSVDQHLLAAYEKLSEQARDPKVLVETNTAWRTVHKRTEEIKKVKTVANGVLDDFSKGSIEEFVVLGIGGSDLGARALHDALNCGGYYNMRVNRSTPRIHFIGDNSCPEEIAGLLDSINLRKTVFNVISKSGTTPETLANFFILRQKLIDNVGKESALKSIIATTGENEKSELWISGHAGTGGAGEELFRSFLPVPDGIGGRFSVFSPVGLLYAAVSGLDIDEMMVGIQQAETRAESHPLSEENCAYQLAKVLYLSDTLRLKNIVSYFPFDNRLEGISRWFRQLWAESLGKTVTEQLFIDNDNGEIIAKLFFSAGKLYRMECSGDISVDGDEERNITLFKAGKPVDCKIQETKRVTGTTPLAWVGSRDNHSSWQLGSAGPKDKVVIFTRVDNYPVDFEIPVEEGSKLHFLNGRKIGHDLERASQMGTEEDAVKNGIPNVTLVLPSKNEKDIADYMYTLMMMTAVAGELYEINAFDQPAVEGYKILTKKILSENT